MFCGETPIGARSTATYKLKDMIQRASVDELIDELDRLLGSYR